MAEACGDSRSPLAKALLRAIPVIRERVNDYLDEVELACAFSITRNWKKAKKE
jgi:hypothetical protein